MKARLLEIKDLPLLVIGLRKIGWPAWEDGKFLHTDAPAKAILSVVVNIRRVSRIINDLLSSSSINN